MFITRLFLALTAVSTVAHAAPAPAADSEQIAQLLDQLGVRALLEQTPTVLAVAVEAQMQFSQAAGQLPPSTSPARQTPAQSASWRRDLEAQLKPQLLLQSVTHYLRDHYRADTFRQAQQRLQEPLAKRVRYFDLAMTQAGAEKNLREFIAAHKAEHSNGTADESNSAVRRALLGEIDTATASSLLMATLQSAIAARVKQAAGQGVGAATALVDTKVFVDARVPVDTAVLEAEIAERQRYLAPLAIDYLFYDYRYLRDDELRDYRDLMRDETLQWLLDIARQGVLVALVSGLTPPPLTPPPNRQQ